ncbi:MAG TPA: pitrilysin family protein [Candidatus Magasanikbacteria bacterium]|nr:pitrilysin family protein [Candidatus Magasanikbacteria bacterium]
MFERYQLHNGAEVCLVPIKDAQSTTVLIMYPVGSRYESFKLNGVSHYIEHLFFKGTKKRPTTLKLTSEIDRLGAEYNAFTSKEYTGYYIKAAGNFLETSLDILSDMLFNSLFDAKEMEREKKVIAEEIKMYNDNPLMHIDSVFEQSLYNGSPLAWDIAGTVKHVHEYKREDVLKYRDTYYDASAMKIVIAGAMNAETKQLVEKYFGIPATKKKMKNVYKPVVYGSTKRTDRLVIDHKTTDQVQMMLGFPSFSHTDERLHAQTVMNTILGGSMSSRLFIQIRERRGLAYMVRSGADQFRDTGYTFIRSGLEATNINKALDVIKNEIEKMVEKGVTKKELEDAKTHIRGSFTLSLEDSSMQANYYARHMLFQKDIETPEEILSKIDTVTHDEIRAVAKKLFNWKQARLAIIGNTDESKIKF